MLLTVSTVFGKRTVRAGRNWTARDVIVATLQHTDFDPDSHFHLTVWNDCKKYSEQLDPADRIPDGIRDLTLMEIGVEV